MGFIEKLIKKNSHSINTSSENIERLKETAEKKSMTDIVVMKSDALENWHIGIESAKEINFEEVGYCSKYMHKIVSDKNKKTINRMFTGLLNQDTSQDASQSTLANLHTKSFRERSVRSRRILVI